MSCGGGNMRYIDLRSDTVSLPTAEMLDSIPKAILGDDVMEEDQTVKQLEELGATMFGKEAGLFTASGTMSNQIAVMVHTQRGDEVIVGAESHIYNLEVSGLSTLSQVQARTVSAPDGYFNPELVEQAIQPVGIQTSTTGLICLENTYNLNRGFVMTPENIDEISIIAKKHGIPLYMDGARIFNAAIALGRDVKEFVGSVDSVQVCLTKGLAAPVGSLLMGSKEFIDKSRRIRQRLGGGMRQAGIIAAPGIIALQRMVNRLEDDHLNARKLAQGLYEIENSLLNLNQVHTNIVSIDISSLKIESNVLLQQLNEKGIKIKKTGSHQFRMITHHQISAHDINYVLNVFKEVLYT